MKKLRFKVISKTFDCNKIEKIQQFVDELCEKNMKSVAIAMEVGKKFKCSVSIKYIPENGYAEMICLKK